MSEQIKKTSSMNLSSSNSNEKEIETDESDRLSLGDEVVEHLIEILGGMGDFSKELSLINANIGNMLNLSYVTLRWVDKENSRFSLETQWKSQEHYPDLHKHYQFTKQKYNKFLKSFTDGVRICTSTAEQSEQGRETYMFALVKASIQCLVYENEVIVGVMTFAYVDHEREWTQKEMKIIKLITKVLSLHLSAAKKSNEIELQVEKLAIYDKITGLYTYGKFKEAANRILSKNIYGEKFALVYSDFTSFKYINDTYGYAVGDSILKEFAEFIVDNNQKAIIGAREYADNILALVRVKDEQDLADHVNEYSKLFSDKQNAAYPGLNMRVSSGAYIIEDKNVDVVTAIDNANIARKLIKEKQRGGYLQFHADMLNTINMHMKILADFSDALENNEFQMYLQPQIDIDSGKTVGAEALVRWIKPDGSVIYPDVFIPLLEKTGNIVELDLYMYECALQTLKEWKQERKELIPISINFSRIHFYNDRLLDNLIEKLRQYEVEPKYIDIEITEGLFMEHYERFANYIQRIRESGFSISIDDFGTGYSSLSILTSLNIQAIKIDKSFLYGAEKSEAQKNIIEYMLSLAKELKLGVVCEGVETEKQIAFLKGVGCKVVQGYFYDKPIKKHEFNKTYMNIEQ